MTPTPSRNQGASARRPSSRPPSESPPSDDSQRSRQSPPVEEDSGTGSSAAEFVTDPGPGFDPEHAPEPPVEEQRDELELLLEQWSEEQVRGMLVTQGNITHVLLKVSPEDVDTWKHTEDDLRTIAPPLTRILNRYDATRAAAAAGDEILLGTGLFTYGVRNYTRRRKLLAQRDAEEPQPVTGVPAPPETGPEYDPDYQRVRPDPPALVPKGPRR